MLFLLGGCDTGGRSYEEPPPSLLDKLELVHVVGRYCLYGSQSPEQWRGCTDHVTEDELRKQPMTNARRFATDRMNECRYDAGPLCSSNPSGKLLDFKLSTVELLQAYGEVQENYNP